MSFKKVNQKQNFPKLEKETLKFWQDNKIFEKSVETKDCDKQFTFYDGPPFATGLPHYGHLLAGFIKDAIPRYKTMQGYRVDRKWGWDTHGLPIENIVEQELGFTNKKQIEEYGIEKFNEKCRSKVLEYAEIWKEQVARTGRWVDMENAYLTMDPEYMESIWWVFKTLYQKDLICPGYKVMPFCPRCSTPLSNFETGQGYADKKDKAITVKFQMVEEPNTYILAWTTTPWTLPSNMALAVGKDITYVKVKNDDQTYVLAKDRLNHYDFAESAVIEEMTGKDLVELNYVPLFGYFKKTEGSFRVIPGDFVSTADGTGIVHIAPAYGVDDYNVSKDNQIGFINPVDEFGRFAKEVTDFAGESVVDPETNEKIIEFLDKSQKIVKKESITHSYPHCYRCDTPLIYRAVESWFVDVPKLKKDLLANNEKIYWMPEFVGKGRFHKLLERAPDWNISRNRYWGTPLPIWQCNECKECQVFGSIDELEKVSKEKITDLHLHKINHIELTCECGGKAKLSGEVLDCWFESGSMPYASNHYPFVDKDKFTSRFPADFIAEGIDQTRGWFNSLLILSTGLFNQPAMKNVVVNGTILAEDGQKMSKRLKNYPDPMDVIGKYGADAVRFYLLASPAVKAEDLRFSEKGVDEVVKKVILTLWNSYSFFVTYASIDGFQPTGKLESENNLDYWIISETNQLVKNVTEEFEAYDLASVAKHLLLFIDDLSNWYIRRSRRRFWKSENDTDKNQAYETLYYVLNVYIQLLAPYMPFVTDEIYKNLVLSIDKSAPESIHLTEWPKYQEDWINKQVNDEIHLARQIVELGLKIRAQEGINVRQPLSEVTIFDVSKRTVSSEIKKSISEELNVKKVTFKGSQSSVDEKIELLTNINFKAVGPRLGAKVKDVSKALLAGDYILEDGKYMVLGEEFTSDEVEVRLSVEKENNSVVSEGGMAVALDINVSDELKQEGLARELIRQIQEMRKRADFNVEDRIEVAFDTESEAIKVLLSSWGEYIANEVLATKFVLGTNDDSEYNELAKIENSEIRVYLKRVSLNK